VAIQTINPNSVQPLGVPNTGTGSDQGDTWDVAVAKLNAMFVELYAGGAFVAGGGSASYEANGNLVNTAGPVTSGNTATSQTLASYTLPANSLQDVGQEINVTAWGVVAGNAASKSIALNIGGTTVNTGTQTGSGYTWLLSGKYIKSSGNAQNYFYSGNASGAAITQKAGTDTSVDTGTIAVNVVATDASAASSDITLLGFTVEFFA
jgi:hypothetical protein